MNNTKIIGIQIFSKGNETCLHDWVYNKPLNLTFTVPAKIVQERVCECCGRFERVHLEGRQANYDTDRFTATKEQFGLEL